MKSAFDRAIVWHVDHRRATLVLILVTTAIAVCGHVRPDLVRSLFIRPTAESTSADPLPASTPRPVPPPVSVFSFGGADAILVGRSEQFFSKVGARAMRRVVERLEELDYVREVLWVDRLSMLNIFGLREPLFPRSEASDARFAAARDKAMQHPLVKGQLVSEDGRTMLLMVTLDRDFLRRDEQCTSELRQAAEQAAAEFPDFSARFQVTGKLPSYVTAMRVHEANRVKYQVIGYGVVVLMAILLFRGIRAVLIVSLAPVAGVLWTLGFLKFFNLQDNPFNDVILPVLLSLVGFTDGVHLMVLLRKLRASGMPERDAAREALRQVGFACTLTSLTTAIGLGSLTLANSPLVREFGWCCVIGVTTLFLAVVWIIPLVCSTWLGRKIHAGYEKSLIDRNLNRISGLIEFVLRYPRQISVAGIVVTLGLTAISLTLRPDERRSNSLPQGSEAYQALAHLDQVMGGLEFAQVDLTWSDQMEESSPEILRTIIEVDDLLRSEPSIGYPLSIRNLIDALPGEGAPEDRMSMLELLPPPLKRAFFTPEWNRAQVTFRVQDLGIAKYGRVFERLKTGLREIQQRHPQFTLDLSGGAVWRWQNIYQIVVDLAASLGTAAIIIFGVLGLAYRSLRIGLIAIIPNIFPLAVTGAWLVFSGYALEMVSVCAFTICLGIAVDDTIHFLSRFEEERAVTPDRNTAIRRAFGNAGVAMVMTTVVLVAGFASVAFSDSRDHYLFAMMGVITIGSALFGDLVLLPALLACYAPLGRSPTPDSFPQAPTAKVTFVTQSAHSQLPAEPDPVDG